jgi:hypothetical protein
MLKLSEILHVKQVPLKKAAGEDLVVWDDTPAKVARPKVQEDAQILNFPKKNISSLAPLVEEPVTEKPQESEPSNLLNSEVVLWQREISKHATDEVHKLDAFKGYKKSTEMYVVKTPNNEGKDKIRFASTNGVLINKKQA